PGSKLILAPQMPLPKGSFIDMCSHLSLPPLGESINPTESMKGSLHCTGCQFGSGSMRGKKGSFTIWVACVLIGARISLVFDESQGADKAFCMGTNPTTNIPKTMRNNVLRSFFIVTGSWKRGFL